MEFAMLKILCKRRLILLFIAMLSLASCQSFFPEEEKGLNMVSHVTTVPFKINGQQAGHLSILAGNYIDHPNYAPQSGAEKDFEWSVNDDVVILDFHPRRKYRSPYGGWAKDQFWAYIGFSRAYDLGGETVERIKVMSSPSKSLHLKFLVKAHTDSPELLMTVRAGGAIADSADNFEKVIEIDDYPNLTIPLSNAASENFDDNYNLLKWSDWTLVNDEWVNVDLNITQIGYAALEKCSILQGKTIEDLYLFEAIVGPEFKTTNSLTIRVKDFEIYEQ